MGIIILFEQGDKAKTSVIVGFVETATQEDITLIKTFINHPIAKIRAAVLYALNRLKVEEINNLYLLGLQDSNTMVRNACISILQSGYSHLRPELEELLKNDNFKLQKATLKILINYGTLDSLKDILFALTQPSEKLQAIAWQYLASWHSKYSRQLGFNFKEDTYKSTLQLLEKLKETNIKPPNQVSYAWNDIPNIIKIIKKK
ncbi:HEAT repeat domain-containing protein [Rickettsia hoogstraalii]|uniref:HEAT repeat domain-containing protein n=1 Tax=Rickettsia hoogstraalii TaxID=467174 RepID=UPI00058B8F17|nr:HEAT repeat domain-containing protein [Rickettsia hoogstraalii]